MRLDMLQNIVAVVAHKNAQALQHIFLGRLVHYCHPDLVNAPQHVNLVLSECWQVEFHGSPKQFLCDIRVQRLVFFQQQETALEHYSFLLYFLGDLVTSEDQIAYEPTNLIEHLKVLHVGSFQFSQVRISYVQQSLRHRVTRQLVTQQKSDIILVSSGQIC